LTSLFSGKGTSAAQGTLPQTLQGPRPLISIMNNGIEIYQPLTHAINTMDSDLLSDRPPALAGSLLPNLSYQSLTDHCDVTDHWEPGRNESITHPRVSHVNEAGAVISRIEDIFEAISDCILDEKKELTIQLKTRKKTGKQEHASNSRESTRASEADVSTIRYPSKKPQEAWKFGEWNSAGRHNI